MAEKENKVVENKKEDSKLKIWWDKNKMCLAEGLCCGVVAGCMVGFGYYLGSYNMSNTWKESLDTLSKEGLMSRTKLAEDGTRIVLDKAEDFEWKAAATALLKAKNSK